MKIYKIINWKRNKIIIKDIQKVLKNINIQKFRSSSENEDT